MNLCVTATCCIGKIWCMTATRRAPATTIWRKTLPSRRLAGVRTVQYEKACIAGLFIWRVLQKRLLPVAQRGDTLIQRRMGHEHFRESVTAGDAERGHLFRQAGLLVVDLQPFQRGDHFLASGQMGAARIG